MTVEAIALTDFVHGSIDAREGRAFSCDEGLAGDLERAGLIRIKMHVGHANKMMPAFDNKEAAGKAVDDGKGQPSSASPADPVSQTTTLHLSKPGEIKPPKGGT